MTSRKTVIAIILSIASLAVLLCCARPNGENPPVTATSALTPNLLPVSQTQQPARAITPASALDPNALLPHLPADAVIIDSVSLRTSGSLEPLVVALLGFAPTSDRIGYGRLELVVFDVTKTPSSSRVWASGPTVGDRGEKLQVRDINSDGVAEVLSVQSAGAAGQMLYVLGFVSGNPVWLRPSGGRFKDQDYFGETGVWLEDIDGDGLLDILASYGPAATMTDVYRWDGFSYAFSITLQDK